MLRTADKRLLLADGRGAQLNDVMGEFSWLDAVLPITSGLVGWYAADDASTIIKRSDDSDGCWVWKDKSGNNHHLIQSTVAARPTTGTRTLNGLNVLDFDGGDYLDSVGLDSSDRTQTSFFVFLCDSTANGPTLRSGGSAGGTGGNHFVVGGAGPNLITNKENIAQLALQNNATVSTATAYCGIQVLDTNTITHYLGTTSEQDSDSTTFTAGRTLRIGARFDAAQALDGYIAEVLIYDGALSSSDITDVRSYLTKKWGVS